MASDDYMDGLTPRETAEWVLSLSPGSLKVEKLERYTGFDYVSAREWALDVIENGSDRPFPQAAGTS